MEAAAEVERLVDGHLLGQRHDRDSGLRRIDDEGVDHVGLPADRADARHVAEGPRRREHPEPVAAGREVDDHEVVGAGARGAPAQLRQLPDLAHRHELAQAGCGRGEVLEDPVLEQQRVERPRPDLEPQVLLESVLRIDRDRGQAGRELRLLEADLARRGGVDQARQARLARDLAQDRPLAPAGGGEAERGGHGRLANAPLPRDEGEPLVEQRSHPDRPLRVCVGRIPPRAYE